MPPVRIAGDSYSMLAAALKRTSLGVRRVSHQRVSCAGGPGSESGSNFGFWILVRVQVLPVAVLSGIRVRRVDALPELPAMRRVARIVLVKYLVPGN